jgi:signal transduction histidine kinase
VRRLSRREEIAVIIAQAMPATVPVDALCLYRVAQEALETSPARGVTEACVTLNAIGPGRVVHRGSWRGSIRKKNAISRLGLSSMAERVALVRGRFSVASAVGRGTTIEVCRWMRARHEPTAHPDRK